MIPKSTIAVLLRDFALGGLERSTIRLANAWADLGHEVILFVGDGSGPQRRLVRAGVIVETPPFPLAGGRGAARRLGRWFGEGCLRRHADVAYVPGNFYFRNIAATVAATRGKVPVYARISNRIWRPERSLLHRLQVVVRMHLRLRRTKGFVAMSEALGEEARRTIGLADRCRVIREPIFERPPAPSTVPRRPWHICAVGRLEPQKNFRLLLDVIARLKDLPVTLSIAGDGSLRGALEEQARALGIADRVAFLGTVDDVQPCLAEAEVMLLTSDFEGYPAVVIEAFAAGTYVIARNCSDAIPEMISSAGLGSIVEGFGADAFADAVCGYFAHREKDVALMAERAGQHLALPVALAYLDFFGIVSPPPRGGGQAVEAGSGPQGPGTTVPTGPDGPRMLRRKKALPGATRIG